MPGSLGLSRIFAHANRRHPVVLAFHGVTSDAPGHLCNYQGKHLHLPIFTRLMEHLRERYAPVPLSRVTAWLGGRDELPEGAAAVTFDDGYRNVITNAAPVLSSLGIPATVYVVTEFVEKGEMVWTDKIVSALAATARERLTLTLRESPINLPIGNDREKIAADRALRALCKSLADEDRVVFVDRIVESLGVGERELLSVWADHEPLRSEDLRALRGHGIEVGSHTASHKILTRCSPAETRRQLEESKRFIEGVTGQSCTEFSYPNGGPGDFDGRTGACAIDAGYQSAVTSIPTRVPGACNPFEIPRYTLAHNETTLAEFAAELSGYSDFFRGVKRRVIKAR